MNCFWIICLTLTGKYQDHFDMKRYIRYFFLFLFFFSIGYTAEAQINFGVGYSLGYLNPDEDQRIFRKFNQNNPWLEKELEPINFIQGLHLSLRYRVDFVALSFTWRNRFRTRRANGIDPSTDASFRRQLTHRYIGYSLGIETFVGPFSYGGSIDVENFGIRTEVTGVDGDFTIFSKYGLGNHFFISYTLDAGDNLGFSIRPYVHIPWQKYNIASVAEEVNGDISTNELEENYMNFGIMFVFFNGRQ